MAAADGATVTVWMTVTAPGQVGQVGQAEASADGTAGTALDGASTGAEAGALGAGAALDAAWAGTEAGALGAGAALDGAWAGASTGAEDGTTGTTTEVVCTESAGQLVTSGGQLVTTMFLVL